MKETHAYDVIVVGGGTGGLRAAMMLSQTKKTLLIEPGALGGTCLNVGCIPTKAMLHAAKTFKEIKAAKELGIVASPKLQFTTLMNRVRSIITEGQKHIKRGIIKKDLLTIVKKKAIFLSAKKIAAGQEHYTAPKILISTGAKNFVPPIEGLIDYLDNESIIQLTKLPKSLIMIGGGYISMEFASFFALLGTKITILERAPTVLGMLDEDIRRELVAEYEEMGVKMITNCDILSIKRVTGGFEASIKDLTTGKPGKVRAEKVSVSVGRIPNTKELEHTGIQLTKRGGIYVNDQMQTTVSGVYAIGDCTGKALFAHAAKRECLITVNNILHSKKKKISLDLVPWAVFTHPVIAGVGLSETQASTMGFSYNVHKASFTRCGRAEIINQKNGFVKILVDTKSRRVIGATIIGANADDIIHEFVILMQLKGTYEQFKEAIHIHPTLSEVCENL
ncbi:MAG: mycothione reductase [Candidatus Woesearchaeota archaeon]